jgi:hypothetical protein
LKKRDGEEKISNGAGKLMNQKEKLSSAAALLLSSIV